MTQLHFPFFILFILGLFFCPPSHAFQTKKWSYEIPRKNFIPGYTAYRIQEGLLIGHYKTDPKQKEAGTPSSNPSQKLQQPTVEQQNEQRASYPDLSQITLKDSFFPSPVDISEVLTDQPPNSTHPDLGIGQGLSELNAPLFFKCSQEHMNSLKQILVLEDQLQSTQGIKGLDLTSRLNQLKAKLNKTRSVRVLGALPQMTCSSFLGPSSFPVQTVLDEIKLLTATEGTTRKKEDDLKQLLKGAWLAYHPSVALQNRLIPKIYQEIWKELSLSAVFHPGSEALPSFDQLTLSLHQRNQSEPDGLLSSMSLQALQKRVKAGQTFLEQAWRNPR